MQMVNLSFSQMALLKKHFAKKVKYHHSISKEYDRERQTGCLCSVVYLVTAEKHSL